MWVLKWKSFRKKKEALVHAASHLTPASKLITMQAHRTPWELPISTSVTKCIHISKAKIKITPYRVEINVLFSFCFKKKKCILFLRDPEGKFWPKLKTNRNGNTLNTLYHLCCDSYSLGLYVELSLHKFPISYIVGNTINNILSFVPVTHIRRTFHNPQYWLNF